MCIPELILLPPHHNHHDSPLLPRVRTHPQEEWVHRRNSQVVRERRRASTPVNVVRISPRIRTERIFPSEERRPSPEPEWRSGFQAGQHALQKEQERLAIEAKKEADKLAASKAAEEAAAKEKPEPPPPPPPPAPAPAPTPPPELPQQPQPPAVPLPPKAKAEAAPPPEPIIYYRRRDSRRRSPSDDSVSTASFRAVKRRLSIVWGRVSGLERWRNEREREREVYERSRERDNRWTRERMEQRREEARREEAERRARRRRRDRIGSVDWARSRWDWERDL